MPKIIGVEELEGSVNRHVYSSMLNVQTLFPNCHYRTHYYLFLAFKGKGDKENQKLFLSLTMMLRMVLNPEKICQKEFWKNLRL